MHSEDYDEENSKKNKIPWIRKMFGNGFSSKMVKPRHNDYSSKRDWCFFLLLTCKNNHCLFKPMMQLNRKTTLALLYIYFFNLFELLKVCLTSTWISWTVDFMETKLIDWCHVFVLLGKIFFIFLALPNWSWCHPFHLEISQKGGTPTQQRNIDHSLPLEQKA